MIYAEMSKEELQDEVERQGLEVAGTGANGNVLKSDLISALEAATDSPGDDETEDLRTDDDVLEALRGMGVEDPNESDIPEGTYSVDLEEDAEAVVAALDQKSVRSGRHAQVHVKCHDGITVNGVKYGPGLVEVPEGVLGTILELDEPFRN